MRINVHLPPPPLNYCNRCGNNVANSTFSAHYPSTSSLGSTSLQCHSLFQPISPTLIFTHQSRETTLGSFKVQPSKGGLQANTKTFWSRVTFADCCRHLLAFLLQRISVVSRPVGGQCLEEIGEERKEVAREEAGEERFEEKSRDRLLLFLSCHKKESDWKMQLLLVLTHCFTTDMFRRKRCFAQNYIVGLPTNSWFAWFYHPVPVPDLHPKQAEEPWRWVWGRLSRLGKYLPQKNSIG